MITERLRSETRPQHDAMEQVGYSDKIMSGRLSLAEYKLLIRNNYLMNAITEQAMEAYPELTGHPALEYEARKKGALLEQDLLLLGLNKAEIDQHSYRLPVSNALEALGAYYVMEGSTLGGAVISRQLAKTESLQGVGQFHFYGCYGDQVGPRWKAFQAVLLSLATDAAAEDQIIAGANKAFDYFRQIFLDSQKAA